MLFDILKVSLGFVCLYFGAQWTVTGAIRIGNALNLAKAFLGLTVVAFSTSSPELMVNLLAASRGYTAFSLSNISGSNLANLCVGFGLCGLFSRLAVSREVFRADLIYFCIGPILMLLFFFFTPDHSLPLFAAVPLLCLIGAYLYSKKSTINSADVESNEPKRLGSGIFLLILGAALLYLGGELVLRAAVSIAGTLGISDAIIGFTIVAVGTSIPDIMASIIAARRGENAIAVGNLLGSNIFNIFLVIGGTLIVYGNGLTTDSGILMDYCLVAACSVLFYALINWTRLSPRIWGGGLLGIYLVYTTIRVIAGT
ncbi:sodium:calcium antiporter [Desulfatibacillum aliphaticivorans]|uniref:sodium:calcium antiporter n=1 Tax=Desulfatibacillum aliphaticivorans TaxID=218208 RepID=UPI000A01A24D|nr:sodium:calcium antiporter [Desulfatibacillum aliphaticivorans]